MVRRSGLYRQPIRSYEKYVYKSIFPTSNANSDSRIEFCAKKYVRSHITKAVFLITSDREPAAQIHNKKNWEKFHTKLAIKVEIKHFDCEK
jgi:predicted RNA-binding protein with PIN domain